MTLKVEVGTILIEDRPSPRFLGLLESEPYSGNSSVIKGLDGFSLDRKIHAAGWNFFFMAAEVKVMIFGAVGATKIQSALKRILERVRQQNFNCFEVTGIVAKRFLGVPYATVSGHSRHVQQSCMLDGVQDRQTAQRRLEAGTEGMSVGGIPRPASLLTFGKEDCSHGGGALFLFCPETGQHGIAIS